MSDVTKILDQIGHGDKIAAEQLLPLVYDELRQLAARRLTQERPGQTLQATALVHEAYLRLIGTGERVDWDNRRHFFAAAAEAMRRILIDRARQKQAVKRGGGWERKPLPEEDILFDIPPNELLEMNEALSRLAEENQEAAEMVKLRVFAGMSVSEASSALGQSRTSGYRLWAYARAWLMAVLDREE